MLIPPLLKGEGIRGEVHPTESIILTTKLLVRVKRFIQEHRLVQPDKPLVVAVSGGADSVCLLHVLLQLGGDLGFSLRAAHLNHKLRGEEADADAHYVAALAQRLEIPATLAEREVRRYQEGKHLSLEEAAREVRYSFLAEVAAATGAGRVAVGHTADDQVETILMHLVRGSGLAGLRGMAPLSRWRSHTGQAELTVVRPLLEVTRAEAAAYCAAHDLAPRADSSNESLAYLRNRFRSELIPLLRRYNPRVSQALLRTAAAAADDLAYFDEEVSRRWGNAVTEQPYGLVLHTGEVRALPPALRRHLLRAALERQLGDLTDVESSHIEAMTRALAGPAGKRLSLPGGLVFYVDYGACILGRGEGVPCPLPALEGEHRLNVPGETLLPGWRVSARILDPPPPRGEPSPWRACLDFDQAGPNLVVRGRRPGDRFQPLGLEASKKLQDFMVDVKIPRPWRSRVPLVCSPQGILWVVGWRVGHLARLTSDTKRALLLEFERV